MYGIRRQPQMCWERLIFTSPLKKSPSGHPVFYPGAGPAFLWGVVGGRAPGSVHS